MKLKTLIKILSEYPEQDKIIDIGFSYPMSYRGYGNQLAFNPDAEITVASMLDNAKSALDKVFDGYKGGESLMTENTECWIAEDGKLGEKLTKKRLKLILSNEYAFQ